MREDVLYMIPLAATYICILVFQDSSWWRNELKLAKLAVRLTTVGLCGLAWAWWVASVAAKCGVVLP
jgi:hypothetical protein